ncbi:Uncharacterised protein [Mycobacteroides abscessus subsp. abscessus]|nr:Uncharacterised protein [Mycobacteroides abscessus subsp. abscessus]SKU70545.1 Uncharacterised protein [Mycobacteroides abscessus subsp. abscessus]
MRGHTDRRQPAKREIDVELADRTNGIAVHRNIEFCCNGR